MLKKNNLRKKYQKIKNEENSNINDIENSSLINPNKIVENNKTQIYNYKKLF